MSDQPTPREVIVATLHRINGEDPEYDDGIDADAILAALSAAGFAVVPREASVRMVAAATSRPQPDPEPLMYAAIWRAMLAAGEARDA